MSIRTDMLLSSPPRLSLDDDWSLDAPVKTATVDASEVPLMPTQQHRHTAVPFKHALMQTRVVHHEVLVDQLDDHSALLSDGAVPVDSPSESRVKPYSDADQQDQSTPVESSEKLPLDVTTSSNIIPLRVSTRTHSNSDFNPSSPPFESTSSHLHSHSSASPNSVASAGSPISRTTSSVSTCSTSTSSSSSASVARDRSHRSEPQSHTIVPLAQSMQQIENNHQHNVEPDMSLLESMRELSLVDETMNQTMKLPQEEDEIASELEEEHPHRKPSVNGTEITEELEATQILPAEDQQDDTPVVTPPQPTRDDISSKPLIESAEPQGLDFFHTRQSSGGDPFELQHNLTIDTLAQMHQHQYWTPFVNRRNKRQQQLQQLLAHTPRNNLQQLDLSSITPAKENHTATFSPSTPMDCYESVSNFTTPYSQKKSHTRLEAELPITPFPLSSPTEDFALPSTVGSDGHEYDGPFLLKSELQCAEFFRNRRGDEPSPWQTFQLYDPITETEVPQPDWVRQLAINGFKNGDDDDGDDEETEEVDEEGENVSSARRQSDDASEEQQSVEEDAAVPFNPSTPVTRSPNRVVVSASPFESPFQPPASAIRARATYLQADASFSFSPIPVPALTAITPAKIVNPAFGNNDCITPYSTRKPQVSVTSTLKASSHPISILKTPQPSQQQRQASALKMQSSPDMHFALASPMPTRNAAFAAGDLFLSPIPAAATHEQQEVEGGIVGNDVRKLELQLSAAAARAFSSMNNAPHQAKSVRFDVPSSHETTLNSSSEQDQLQQQQAANQEPFAMHRLQPQPLTAATIATAPSPNASYLSFVHELSNFDTTALEANFSNHSLMAQQKPSSEIESQQPFRFDTSAEFSVGIVEFDPNVEGNRGRPFIPSAAASLNRSMQSQSMNSFFVPFEKLDQTSNGFAHTVNGASSSKNVEQVFASSTSSNEGGVVIAPFTIVVDGPVDAPAMKTAETVAQPLAAAVTVEDGPPESSFYTSSSSDSQNDSTVNRGSSRNNPVSARTPARVTSIEQKNATPATSLLALPSSSRRNRSRRSPSSNRASPAGNNGSSAFERASARIPITRAHTDSAHTIRVRARHHRKNRCATGQKKRSMRILPASVAADINRTLTFDSSSSSSASSMNDSKQQSNFTFNMSPIAMNPDSSKKSHKVLSPSPVELQKLHVEMTQRPSSASQRRMHSSRSSRSPSSSPPSRRHLDFSSHAPEVNHGVSTGVTTSNANDSWLEGNDSARINLSQSFEAVTEWGPTPRKLNRSASSYSIDSSFASSTATNNTSLQHHDASRMSASSDSPLQFTQLPSTPMQDAIRAERYEPLAQPLPIVESDIDFANARHPLQQPESNLYESHQLRSKLRAYFSPHSVEAIMARRRLSPSKLKQLERLERELFAQQRIQEQLRVNQQQQSQQPPSSNFPISPIPRRVPEQVFSPGFGSSFAMNPHSEIPPQPASPFRAYPLADSHQQQQQQAAHHHHGKRQAFSFSPMPEVFQQQPVANEFAQFQPAQLQVQQQMMPVQLFMCVPVPTVAGSMPPMQPMPFAFGQHLQSPQSFAAALLPPTSFAPQLDKLQAEMYKFSSVHVNHSRAAAQVPQSPTVFPSFVPWSRGVRPLSPPKLQPPLPTQAFAAKLSPSAGLSEARHRLCMSLTGAPTRASAARHVTPSFRQYY